MCLTHSLRRVADLVRFPNRLHRQLIRELFDLVGYLPLARGTRMHPIAGGTTRGSWISARNADEGAGVLLYLHGGGFVFGGTRTHRHLTAALSAACELQVWPGQVHVFPAFFPLIPEGWQAIR